MLDCVSIVQSWDTVPPILLLIFFFCESTFLAIFHVLITYYSNPPSSCILFFAARGRCFVFLLFWKKMKKTKLNTVAPVRVKSSLIAFFMFSVVFIYFFFSSSDGTLATALPFQAKNICGVICEEFIGDGCAACSRTHLQKGWMMFIYRKENERRKKPKTTGKEKGLVIECPCFIG